MPWIFSPRQALTEKTKELYKELRSYGLEEKDVRIHAWSEYIGPDKSASRYLDPSHDTVDFKTCISLHVQSETAVAQYLELLEKGTTR